MFIGTHRPVPLKHWAAIMLYIVSVGWTASKKTCDFLSWQGTLFGTHSPKFETEQHGFTESLKPVKMKSFKLQTYQIYQQVKYNNN
jgi:hypothetical protein